MPRASLVLAALLVAAPAQPQEPGADAATLETLAVPVYPGQMVSATLAVPARDAAPWPAVLILAVRAPGDAPAAGALELTEALRRRGVAVVRLDLPPESDGAPADAEPMHQPADDAYAVLQFLREREDVDGDRVALLGLGPAARHAARAATLDEAARALVLLGAGVVDADTLGVPAALPVLSLPLEARAAPVDSDAHSPIDTAALFLVRHLE